MASHDRPGSRRAHRIASFRLIERPDAHVNSSATQSCSNSLTPCNISYTQALSEPDHSSEVLTPCNTVLGVYTIISIAGPALHRGGIMMVQHMSLRICSAYVLSAPLM